MYPQLNFFILKNRAAKVPLCSVYSNICMENKYCG
jgi:hypothetical protein